MLVITTSSDAAVEAGTRTAVVRAVPDDADAVAMALGIDGLAADHPDLAGRLRDRIDDADGTSRAPLHHVPDLLDVTDVHRFVTLDRRLSPRVSWRRFR